MWINSTFKSLKLGFSTNINETTEYANKNNDSHCALSEKKKASEYVVAKDVSYTLESCRKREMKVLRTFILKTTKLLSMLSRVQDRHAPKVCRYFVGQLVLYDFLIALWQFLFRTQCTDYCWTQTTWQPIYHTQFLLHSNYIFRQSKKNQGNKEIHKTL